MRFRVLCRNIKHGIYAYVTRSNDTARVGRDGAGWANEAYLGPMYDDDLDRDRFGVAFPVPVAKFVSPKNISIGTAATEY